MMSADARRSLRKVLVQLYPGPRDAGRIADDANIPTSRVELGGGADTFWHELLKEVERQGKLSALVATVLEEYPDNQELRSVLTRFPEFKSIQVEIGSDLFEPNISTFRAFYLGSPDDPVPFGGRAGDLDRLDQWLDAETAPPYRILTAPAGRGKSALLVRWTERLRQRPDVAFVYLPTTVRSEINHKGDILKALLSRLARVFPPGAVPQRSPSVSDYLSSELSDGRRLLVVLDGLDEIAGGDLGPRVFPNRLPKTSRVLLAARSRDEDCGASALLHDLGLERPRTAVVYELPKLTLSGMEEVFQSAGPRLARRCPDMARLTAKLYELSQGEPLVARLYVDALGQDDQTSVRLTPEDLEGLKPDLKGFFDYWWKEQRNLWGDEAPLRDEAVTSVLYALASALGPMHRDDLCQFLSLNGRPFRISDLEEAVQPIRRLVLSSTRAGYSFSHPLFREYFRKNKMTSDEQKEYDKRLLGWGQAVLDRLDAEELQPNDVPPYLLRSYGDHLANANASPEALFRLTSHLWQRAWETRPDQYAGFLRDVDRAQQAAERINASHAERGEPAPFLNEEIRCLLIQASINSFDDHLPPKLMRALVAERIWTFEHALTHAMRVARPRHDQFLKAVAEMISPERSEQAFEVAVSIKGEGDRAFVLRLFTPRFTRETIANALVAAYDIQDYAARARLLVALLATGLVQDIAKVVRDALIAVRGIEGRQTRVELLTQVAFHIDVSERASVLQEVLFEARRSAERMTRRRKGRPMEVVFQPDEDAVVKNLGTLAPLLPAQMRAQALSIILSLPEEYLRTKLLRKIAPLLSEDVLKRASRKVRGRTNGRVARLFRNPHVRVEALVALLGHLRTPWGLRTLRRAYAEALPTGRGLQQFHTVELMLPYLPTAERQAMLLRSLRFVSHLEDDRREQLLEDLAPHLGPDTLKPALEIVDSMTDGVAQSGALKVLAPRLTTSFYDQATAIAEGIDKPYFRIEAMSALAKLLPDRERYALLERALQVVETLGDGDRMETLRVLADVLPDPLKDRAFRLARGIEDRLCRCEALSDLALGMPSPVRREALHEAYAAVRQVGDEGAANEAIGALTSPPEEQAVDAPANSRESTEADPEVEPALLLPSDAWEMRDSDDIDSTEPSTPSGDDWSPEDEFLGLRASSKNPVEWALGFNGADSLLFELRPLVPELARRSRAELYPIWRRISKKFARFTREECLIGVGILAPVIKALGPEQAATQVVESIRDVLRRWS